MKLQWTKKEKKSLFCQRSSEKQQATPSLDLAASRLVKTQCFGVKWLSMTPKNRPKNKPALIHSKVKGSRLKTHTYTQNGIKQFFDARSGFNTTFSPKSRNCQSDRSYFTNKLMCKIWNFPIELEFFNSIFKVFFRLDHLRFADLIRKKGEKSSLL